LAPANISVDMHNESSYNNNRGDDSGGKKTNVSGRVRKTLERSGEMGTDNNLGWKGNSNTTEEFEGISSSTETGADRSRGVERRQIGGKNYDVVTERNYTPEMQATSEDLLLNGYKTCFVLSNEKMHFVDGTVIIPYQKVSLDKYVYNKGVASFTEQRLNYLLEEHSIGGNKHTDYSKAYVAYISPSDFLNLTANEPILENVKSEATKLDIEELRRQQETPFLEYDPATGDVVNHEGRHRMVALHCQDREPSPVFFPCLFPAS